MDYKDRRIVSWIVNALTHKKQGDPPCADLTAVQARNAALQAPHPVDTIRRLYPIALAAVRNAELVQDRIGIILELKAQGKPIPPELNCKLCDLSGMVCCEEM